MIIFSLDTQIDARRFSGHISRSDFKERGRNGQCMLKHLTRCRKISTNWELQWLEENLGDNTH